MLIDQQYLTSLAHCFTQNAGAGDTAANDDQIPRLVLIGFQGLPDCLP